MQQEQEHELEETYYSEDDWEEAYGMEPLWQIPDCEHLCDISRIERFALERGITRLQTIVREGNIRKGYIAELEAANTDGEDTDSDGEEPNECDQCGDQSHKYSTEVCPPIGDGYYCHECITKSNLIKKNPVAL